MLKIQTPRRIAGFAFLAAAGLLADRAAAVTSVRSLSLVGTTNSTISGGITVLDEMDSDAGALSVATINKSFTGLDRTGAPQTMTFTGTTRTSATFGQLHSYATGTLSNTYYNANNPIYGNVLDGTVNPAGSPDGVASLGFATFDDTLQYGGALQAGYQARFIFHIDGTNSGDGALADLGIDVSGVADDHDAFFVSDLGHTSNNFATKGFAINGTTPQTIHVQFSDQFTFETKNVADGTNAAGTSDFSSTATLTQIMIVDADGNEVSGVTVTSGSGTVYSTIPEPTSIAVLLPVAMITFGRRRSAKN